MSGELVLDSGPCGTYQRLYWRCVGAPTVEGAAYFAWHRLVWGDQEICRGINDRRMCGTRWALFRAPR